MTWNVWHKDGRIEPHKPEREGIAARRRAAERSLNDAAIAGLSPEARFQLAYEAALSIATLVVLATGYRVKSRVGHHQITFEAAGVALGRDAVPLVRYFDFCRRRRNVISYEGDEVGEDQADERLREARRFAALVDSWLARQHPELE